MITYRVTTSDSDLRRTESTAEPTDVTWCGFGDEIVWWQDMPGHPTTEEQPSPLGRDAPAADGALYLIGQVGTTFLREFPSVRVILDKGRYLVVALSAEEAEAVELQAGACFGLIPLPENTHAVQTARLSRRPADPRIAHITESVAPDELMRSLTRLAAFRTRHSLSADFADSAQWAEGLLNSFGFATTRHQISVGAGTSFNLVADRPGTGADPRLILATAHLDSVNLSGAGSPAPGADDNGSGAAGIVEIARLLGTRSHDHDLRLILFGGEEQGLHGSQQYVASLSGADRSRLDAVINMDMIACRNVAESTVLLEGAAVSQQLMDDLSAAAQNYTGLIVQTSLNPFASDHVPFIRAGLPALLTIEGSDSANTAVHTANDTVDRVDPALAAEIVRMNISVLAERLQLAEDVEDCG